MHRHPVAAHPLDRGNHLAHRAADSSAQIHRRIPTVVRQVLKRVEMRIRQVSDVDKIADSRPVWGRIVGTIQVEGLPLPERGLNHRWNEVGLWGMALAENSVRVSSGAH